MGLFGVRQGRAQGTVGRGPEPQHLSKESRSCEHGREAREADQQTGSGAGLLGTPTSLATQPSREE